MNILARSHFLNRLRIEKRRVDRSKAPLSVVLFSFHIKERDNVRQIQEFLSSLHRNTRETDIKGWVDNDVIGLILPDTDVTGAKKYVEKIKMVMEVQLFPQ